MSALQKSLAILDYLPTFPDGVALADIATHLDIHRSGCHEALRELIDAGYVRQVTKEGEDYALTTRMGPLGRGHASPSGVVDVEPGLVNDPHTDAGSSSGEAEHAWMMTL